MFKQYEIFELTKDINPVIKTGMKGVILELLDRATFEVEFLDNEGYNYGYNERYTFTIKAAGMIPIQPLAL